MPDYGPQFHPHDRTANSYYASLRRWLSIKKYQYEVTFSLYMLTPMEKLVFNVILLVLLSLLVTAAVAYLPNHVIVISNRLWYYAYGEQLFSTSSKNGISSTAAVLDGLKKVASSAGGMTIGETTMARETPERILKQMHEL